MIVVTGVTGGLGSAVVKHLLQHMPPHEIRGVARNPHDAEKFSGQGVEVRRGDFDRPETLDGAFVGAERLLLVSSSGIDYEERFRRHRNAIDAVARARVRHVYYTSLTLGSESTAFVMKAHLATEAYLRASGLAYTILKNGAYVEAWKTYLGDLSDDEICIPNDGPINWVARDELAEGTARLLVAGGHVGDALPLTGPAAPTIAATAELISRRLGRPIGRRVVSREEFVTRRVATGEPKLQAERWASTYDGLARGEFSTVDPLLESLLGRPRKTFEQAWNAESVSDRHS